MQNNSSEIIFLPSKIKLLSMYFGPGLIGIVFLLIATRAFAFDSSYYARLFGILFLGYTFSSIVLFLGPYQKLKVKVTDKTIKIVNREIYFYDILSVGKIRKNFTNFLEVKVKDISKYDLGYTQKINMKFGVSPFIINTSIFSEENKVKLEAILRQYTSIN